MKTKPLSELYPEEKGIIVKVEGSGEIRRRLLEMGLVAGAEVEMARTAPLGDPVQIRLRGYDLALRKKEAAKILVKIKEGMLVNAESGEMVTVVAIKAGWGLERRLKDMGLAPGTIVRVASAGQPGPVIIEIMDSKLALGHGIARKILVRSSE